MSGKVRTDEETAALIDKLGPKIIEDIARTVDLGSDAMLLGSLLGCVVGCIAKCHPNGPEIVRIINYGVAGIMDNTLIDEA